MPPNSTSGEQPVAEIASRHGFSVDAAREMLAALQRGNGSMAQFSHPEFGGSGQWMRGGMTMIGDMFNQALKSRVDALCRDLAALANDASAQVGGAQRPAGADLGAAALRATERSESASTSSSRGGQSSDWWPADLRGPHSSGSQNDMRYAYFADQQRLAIDAGGSITVYDTLDHRIGGFSQQQSGAGTMSMSSQHGSVDLATLPVVSRQPSRR